MLDREAAESRRKELKLTQQQAAKLAGMPSKQYWNDVLSGRRPNITMDTLDALAKALQCSPKDLVK